MLDIFTRHNEKIPIKNLRLAPKLVDMTAGGYESMPELDRDNLTLQKLHWHGSCLSLGFLSGFQGLTELELTNSNEFCEFFSDLDLTKLSSLVHLNSLIILSKITSSNALRVLESLVELKTLCVAGPFEQAVLSAISGAKNLNHLTIVIHWCYDEYENKHDRLDFVQQLLSLKSLEVSGFQGDALWDLIGHPSLTSLSVDSECFKNAGLDTQKSLSSQFDLTVT